MTSTSDDEYISAYKALLYIDDAWANLQNQLPDEATNTPWDSDQFKKILSDPNLIDLLRNGAKADKDDEKQKGLFGFWILHKHYDPQGSERVVSFDYNIPGGTPTVITLTQPSTTSDTIAPERWGADGFALEFKQANTSITPTPNFELQFQEIMEGWGLPSCFGLCLSQTPDADNNFLEMSSGGGTRTQITVQVDGKDIPQTAYPSTWALSSPPKTLSSPLKSDIICGHRCVHAVWASFDQETKTASTFQNIADSIQRSNIRTGPGTPSGPSTALGSRSTPQSM